MHRRKIVGWGILGAFLCALLLPLAGAAQQNQVLGEVQIQGKTKTEKTAGVWVDGQYVGYVDELVNDKKILLLPGAHEIVIRQTGYLPQRETINVQPGKPIGIDVNIQRDPNAQFPSGETAEVKLNVTPNRAAVFVDDNYVGATKDFGGVGRAMVIAPGKHHVRIALAGYQDFTTEVNLRAHQKITIKTDLTPGAVPGPAAHSN